MNASSNWNLQWVLLAGSLGSLWAVPPTAVRGENKRPAAAIVSPKRDAQVERVQEVMGRVHIPGHPILLVRPEVAGGEWYIQPLAELNDHGFFKATARFGNERTTRGQKFHLAVVVVRSPEEAEWFKNKDAVTTVPEGMAHSDLLTVVLGDSAPAEAAARPTFGMLVRPTPNSKVRTVHDVSGKLTTKGWPVVLVRPEGPNESWWVQASAVPGPDDEFTSTVRFGNDKTPSGTQFRVSFLTVPNERAAQAFRPGMALPNLPAEAQLSEEVLVTLEKPEAHVAKE